MYNTLVVTDQTETPLLDLNVITFDQYLEDYPKLGETRTRIINLCDTEQYLSRGYYCSLLAESRQHRVLPSVNTINDLRFLDDADEGRLQPPAAQARGGFEVARHAQHPFRLVRPGRVEAHCARAIRTLSFTATLRKLVAGCQLSGTFRRAWPPLRFERS